MIMQVDYNKLIYNLTSFLTFGLNFAARCHKLYFVDPSVVILMSVIMVFSAPTISTLTALIVQTDATQGEARTFILVSQDYETNDKKLLILIPARGIQVGVWSRRFETCC